MYVCCVIYSSSHDFCNNVGVVQAQLAQYTNLILILMLTGPANAKALQLNQDAFER